MTVATTRPTVAPVVVTFGIIATALAGLCTIQGPATLFQQLSLVWPLSLPLGIGLAALVAMFGWQLRATTKLSSMTVWTACMLVLLISLAIEFLMLLALAGCC
ncbi:MAG TPA: hypothetical protein VMS32_08360 [Verrucomicrobiae bacterium]|jgi:hypothetical protein|nr:hypothetical protein [Verrucomicrobiae bacterium]